MRRLWTNDFREIDQEATWKEKMCAV